ncbi:MAG: transcription elongation factor [Thermofilum sp.]|jgi:DNA-directed RNA polymerase subunit M|nr:transcription elongation factor [Thermofilum sp.]
MEFCPKCGGLMVPKKEGKSLYLVCSSCGYKVKVKKTEGYSTRETVTEEKKTRVSVFDVRSVSQAQEERQQAKEEYYEVFLETYSEAEETGEEE